MTDYPIPDYDDAYANGAHIAGAADFPPRWAAQAEAFRTELTQAGRVRLDLRYGSAPSNHLDLFLPEAASPMGLAVFVHGGYWKAFDKSYWSHLAAGPLAHGLAVAMPSYTLCPGNRISGIAREIDRELGKVAGNQKSLAASTARYQRLLLDTQFADKQLGAAMASYQEAQNEARRQQAYVERIVEPNLPDTPIEPQRFRAILSTLALGLVAWGILRMLFAGVKEHGE